MGYLIVLSLHFFFLFLRLVWDSSLLIWASGLIVLWLKQKGKVFVILILLNLQLILCIRAQKFYFILMCFMCHCMNIPSALKNALLRVLHVS